MKTFIVRSQKAIAALVGALTTLASANLLPDPWSVYVSALCAVLTGVATYVLPFVQEVVDEWPEEAEPVHEGDIIEPETDEIKAVTPDTVGIPVVDDRPYIPEPRPFPEALSVDELLERLANESRV